MEWSDTEVELADRLVRGQVLDLDGRPDDQRVVRADCIRDLLRGRRPSPSYSTASTGASTASIADGKDAVANDGAVSGDWVTIEADPRGLRLHHATITGRLDLAHLTTKTDLELDHCTIPEGITANSTELPYLSLTGTTLGHHQLKQSALHADSIHIAGGAYLDDGFTAQSATADGTVRLLSARIGGQLVLAGAALTNTGAGPALTADHLEVTGGAFLDGGFTAQSAGDLGTVRVLSARIGGQLTLSGAALTNTGAGPALAADHLEVTGNAFLNGGFTAQSAGDLGTVRVLSARIGGQLTLTDATLTNTGTGDVLAAWGASVEQDLLLKNLAGRINLTGTTVKGVLFIMPTSNTRVLAVDRFTYRSIVGMSWQQWLTLLRTSTPDYAAQPYRQLAAISTAAGHDSETRKILIAQRQDQLDRAGLSQWAKAWGSFTGVFLGYGYRPVRALLTLLAVTITAAFVFWLPALGGTGLHLKDQTPGQPDAGCTPIDRIILGVDTALPLVTTPVTSTCITTNTPAGHTIGIISVATQLAGWATATLFIAGFTTAVRKT